MVNLHAPNVGGVYALYDYTKKVVYYGKAEYNIKQNLLFHQTDPKESCTDEAYYFNSEICTNPDRRQKELLEEHKRLFEALPKCNENP